MTTSSLLCYNKDMDTEKFHDRGYKALFSHPRLVEELIRSFVKEDFVEDIDFSTISRSFTSFVTEEFKERETDIIWQVKAKESTLYFYLLIEFQSTVDRYMILRLLSYTALFYLELIKDEKVKNRGRLPAVFPLLLYSGNDPWDAPMSVAELIELPARFPGALLPSFSCHKIVERDFPPEALKEMDNIVSRLFLIETAETSDLTEVIAEAVEFLKKSVDPELQRTFGLWIRKLFKKRTNRDIEIDLTTMSGQEVRTMLETNLQRFEEEAMKRGEQKGRLEGRLETAVNMFNAGFDRETVKKLTGLIDKELESIESSRQ
ncbi:MAG: Rpn family recombination-promoting nuclease/putative transposase [Candidatus Eremiobacteraeota bacterium]|nr:Rpn family recombination-promoting nuclease/putative transposase [Candidatus Eremiobacteraeota bacterium]